MGYCKNCGQPTAIEDIFCKSCGVKIPGRNIAVRKTFNTAMFAIIGSIGVFGIMFLIMIWYNPNYFGLPFASMASAQYTQTANKYDPQTNAVARNISNECTNETLNEVNKFGIYGLGDSIVQGCEIDKDQKYMQDNFKYEYDWAATGFWGKGYNMITENISKGYCKSWSITFCSLLRHQNVTCIVRTVKNHAISMVKKDDTWTIYDTTNGIIGGIPSEVFDGWLV
jgi:hypothetical protein